MDCVYCRSTKTVRNGTRNGLQRFLCRDCGRQFNEKSGTLFACMNHTPQEVVFALRLKFARAQCCQPWSKGLKTREKGICLARL